jgi:hypothetical protein
MINDIENNELENTSNFLFYSGKDGKMHVQIILNENTVWTTQKGMSEIFGTTRENITIHLSNILSTNELYEDSVCKEILHTAADGKKYKTKFYNLDAIIAVGYRVNSYNATQFRIWSTRILNEYLTKGFVLDDERLKQGNKLFGKDYFKELLERIREIRASERMFYEKITDLYATSVDYDSHSPETHRFFAKVQNKLEFAIVGKTSAEIIHSRADANKPNMGLNTWKNSGKKGKVLKSDTIIAKNYLEEEEIKQLNVLVNMYLDYAELQVTRNKLMKMQDWSDKLDAFLKFNEYKILGNAGKVKKDVADSFAEKEYNRFKGIHDKNDRSEFAKVIEEITNSNKLPEETDFINKIIETPKEKLKANSGEIEGIFRKGLPQIPKKNKGKP